MSEPIAESAAGAAACVRHADDLKSVLPAPTKGLTFRKGKREANVHQVRDGTVFYGIYIDGDDLPAGLYQSSIDEWWHLAAQAIEHGAVVFTLVRPEPRES